MKDDVIYGDNLRFHGGIDPTEVTVSSRVCKKDVEIVPW